MVRMLLTHGAHVTGTISPRAKRAISTGNLRWVQCDVLNLDSCRKAVSGQDAVLHFAALDGGAAFKKEHSIEIFRSNTQMSCNILEASKLARIKRVLIMSSVEVYSPLARSPIHETSTLIDEPTAQGLGYAWSKRFSEILSEVYFRQYGLPVAIARLGNVYGPGDDIRKQRVIPTFIDHIKKNQPIELYGGQRKTAYLHVDDATRSLLDFLEVYAVGDPVNIVGEHPIALPKLADMIGQILGKKPTVQIKETQLFKPRSFDVTKAKKIFNFHEKVSLEKGLEEIVAYDKGKR